jgi:uncharacterized iron-regulated membrane protein
MIVDSMKSRGRYLVEAVALGAIALVFSGCQLLSVVGQGAVAGANHPASRTISLADTSPVTFDMSGTFCYVAVAAGSTLWMGIAFDSGVSINQLRYGAGFSCSASTPPSPNRRNGCLFLANSPLNLDPQNLCINVDG